MTDGTGTTQYSYVPVGNLGALQLSAETTPLNTIAYTYDPLGRLATRNLSGYGTRSFQYDALGRLSTDSGTIGSFTMHYLGETGQLTQSIRSDGKVDTVWAYQPNSLDRRLASIDDSSARQLFYSITDEGQITGLTEEDGTGTVLHNWTYGYDNANRLQSAVDALGSSYSYTPDAAGNIKNYSGVGATYNALNELTQLGTQAYSWDADGELLSDGQRTYTWDAEGRMVQVTYPAVPGEVTSLSYDGLGRPAVLETTSSGTVTDYHAFEWCGERLCQTLDSAGGIERKYYREGEDLVPQAEHNYYGPDQIGTPRAIIDPDSGTAGFYEYDPLGNPTETASPSHLHIRFAHMWRDDASFLSLTHYRAYDPLTGLWISRDPLGEASDPAQNLYRYAQGDPVNLTDRLGLTAEVPPTAGPSDPGMGPLAPWPPGVPAPPGGSPPSPTSGCGNGPNGPTPTVLRGADLSAAPDLNFGGAAPDSSASSDNYDQSLQEASWKNTLKACALFIMCWVTGNAPPPPPPPPPEPTIPISGPPKAGQ